MLDTPTNRKSSYSDQRNSSVAGSRSTSRAGSVCGFEDASPTIKVCVRVRPFIKEEYLRDGGKPVRCVEMLTRHKVELTRPGPDNRDASLAAAGVRDEASTRTFEFDRSYWSFSKDDPNFATQAMVFQELGETLLNHAISGFNNCIFAYGQTASGKSYSVLGNVHDQDDRGLLPRIVEGLFLHFKQLGSGTTCKCLVSFIEIYNEQIRDLLTPNASSYNPDSKRKSTKGEGKLEVRQHAVLGTYIPGLVECAAGSCSEVLDLIDYGTTIRAVGETAMNQNSSRSHCIFTFKTTVVEPSGQAKMSQTHLVDLAGSERTKRTGATGDRLKEGVAINRSLSTLARVISALASREGQPPFRESKLTYILKESLCGNSKTVMMAAISPSAADYDETLSTLKFAQSVKKVQTHAVVNEVNEKGIEAQLREELRQLREQLMQTEAEKKSDAQQLQAAQSRIKEQEELCSRFGGDWNERLAMERRRQQQRRAVTQSDLANLTETFQEMHRASMVRRQAELAARGKDTSDTSSSEEWDGVASDSSDDSSGKKAEAVLVCMTPGAGAEASALTPQSIHRGTKRLSANGRATLNKGAFTATPERASQVQAALMEIRRMAEEAEKLANSLTPPHAQRVRLHAMVVVDPAAARSATIAVAVVSKRDYDDLLDPSDLHEEEEDRLLEWVSDEQLRRRLAILKENRNDPAQREKYARVGAWTAAAAAVSAEIYGLSESRPAPRQTEEVVRLRSELAAARLEAAQAVGDLAEARGQLDAARRELAIRPPSSADDQFEARSPRSPRPAIGDNLLTTPGAPGHIAAEIAASFRNALGALDQAQAALSGGARPGSRMIRRSKNAAGVPQ